MNTREKAWYVYMLECCDGSLYTGATNDLPHRMGQHLCGAGSKYVRSRLPFQIRYVESCPTKSAALRRESAIKRLSRAAKMELVRTSGVTDTADI